MIKGKNFGLESGFFGLKCVFFGFNRKNYGFHTGKNQTITGNSPYSVILSILFFGRAILCRSFLESLSH
jgi:hypothetical protein